MEKVTPQELPKNGRQLCSPEGAMKFSFLPIPNIYALPTWHCCIFPNKNVQLRAKFNLSVFPTGQANFVPIQLQPEICSASSTDTPRRFPALSPKCQWHANEFHMQMSSSVNGDKSVLLFQFCDSRKNKAASLHICYLLSNTSVKHLVDRFRITHASQIVSQSMS